MTTNLEQIRMNIMSTNVRKKLLASIFGGALSVVVLAFPASVYAQSAAPKEPTSGASTMQPHRLPDETIEKHIKELHDEVQITAAQEDKWNAVAQAMRDDAATVSDLIRDRRDNMDKLNAVDDLRSYQKIADAHADGLKKIIPAFSTLYDSLSDAQKKLADNAFSRGPQGSAKMHGG